MFIEVLCSILHLRRVLGTTWQRWQERQTADSTIPFALESEFSIAVVNSAIAVARSRASSGSPAAPEASRFLPIRGILSDASSTTWADITLIVSVRDAWARVALGDAL